MAYEMLQYLIFLNELLNNSVSSFKKIKKVKYLIYLRDNIHLMLISQLGLGISFQM